MKTQAEIQKAIVDLNKKISDINKLINSTDIFGGRLFNAQQIEELTKLKNETENKRTDLSHAKRLFSRLERIQKLEQDDRTIKEIAAEWKDQAQQMINQQENRIKSAVIKQDEKNQAIREATQFYNQEINAINYITNE